MGWDLNLSTTFREEEEPPGKVSAGSASSPAGMPGISRMVLPWRGSLVFLSFPCLSRAGGMALSALIISVTS